MCVDVDAGSICQAYNEIRDVCCVFLYTHFKQ